MTQKEPRFNYTGHGWEGKNYDRDLGIKDIAKILRTNLKKKYPKCKFSVQIQRYSGGQSLHVHLMEAPFEAIINKGSTKNDKFISIEEQGYKFEQYAQLNEYLFKRSFDLSEMNSGEPKGWNNGAILTREAWDVMNDVCQLIKGYNYDDSDGMIDYFHTNFYMHLNIGKWNRPFKKI